MTWLISESDLLPEQKVAITSAPDRHFIISGGPGVGKTLVILHRAAYLRRMLATENDRFRIILFGGALKDYFAASCKELDIPMKNICTYDSWCLEYFLSNICRRVPRNRLGKKLDFDEIRRAVEDDVLKKRPMLYDFVMVDEGQDLAPGTLSVLGATSRHITIAVDEQQKLYKHGLSESDVNHLLGNVHGNSILTINFRCSKSISSLAACFVDEPKAAQKFRETCLVAPINRENPVLFVAENFNTEIENLVSVARERLMLGERIGILVPKTTQPQYIQKAMRDFGLEAEIRDHRRKMEFHDSRPKILTFHASKGLTFDAVLIPRVIKASFGLKHDYHSLRMMFVAITRASQWVYLSTISGQEPDFFWRLESLLVTGELVRAGEAFPDARTGTGELENPFDDLFA